MRFELAPLPLSTSLLMRRWGHGKAACTYREAQQLACGGTIVASARGRTFSQLQGRVDSVKQDGRSSDNHLGRIAGMIVGRS